MRNPKMAAKISLGLVLVLIILEAVRTLWPNLGYIFSGNSIALLGYLLIALLVIGLSIKALVSFTKEKTKWLEASMYINGVMATYFLFSLIRMWLFVKDSPLESSILLQFMLLPALLVLVGLGSCICLSKAIRYIRTGGRLAENDGAPSTTTPGPLATKAESTFFLDVLVSLFIGGTIFMFFESSERSVIPFAMPIALLGTLWIIREIILNVRQASSSVPKVKFYRKPYYLTSLSLLSPLIITGIYSMTCSGKFCELMFVLSLFPIVPAFLVALIYSRISPNPKKHFIFFLLVYAIATSLLIG